MARLQPLTKAQTNGKTRELLDGVEKKLGTVPNVMRTMANSPAVLEGYLALSHALAKGTLSARLREQIALAVGEENGCEYCVAAHASLGRMAGLSDDEIADSRRCRSADRKADALLTFVRKVVDERGRVNDADVDALRAAGFGDEAITEAIANVAINLFTNYLNHVAKTEVDFPRVDEPQACAACSC